MLIFLYFIAIFSFVVASFFQTFRQIQTNVIPPKRKKYDVEYKFALICWLPFLFERQRRRDVKSINSLHYDLFQQFEINIRTYMAIETSLSLAVIKNTLKIRNRKKTTIINSNNLWQNECCFEFVDWFLFVIRNINGNLTSF